MVWHVKHNRALHEHLFLLRVEIQSVPWVSSRNRVSIEEVAANFWRADARFGFMERPHIPELLTASKALGCTIIWRAVVTHFWLTSTIGVFLSIQAQPAVEGNTTHGRNRDCGHSNGEEKNRRYREGATVSLGRKHLGRRLG